MEAQIKALKEELGEGEGMDWEAVEKIMEGEWDEDEWERVIGTMLNAAADRVGSKFSVASLLMIGGRGETDVR